MIYDLGFSETGKFPRFRDRYVPPELQLEFCAFALTPGMPTEYVLHVFGFRRWGIAYALDLVDSFREICEPLGFENAASITVEDGYALWRPLVKRGYHSVVPHWTSLALQHMIRTKAKSVPDIARELRVTEKTVYNLATSKFDPISFNRLTLSTRNRHFQPVLQRGWR